MLFNAFSMLFNVFSMLFQCFSLRLATGTACPRGQCFSMLFNAFHYFFNAFAMLFQCFFNAFQCPGRRAHLAWPRTPRVPRSGARLSFTMGRRRVPKLARVGTRWHAAPHCKLIRTPLERAHLAWALPPRCTGRRAHCYQEPAPEPFWNLV